MYTHRNSNWSQWSNTQVESEQPAFTTLFCNEAKILSHTTCIQFTFALPGAWKFKLGRKIEPSDLAPTGISLAFWTLLIITVQYVIEIFRKLEEYSYHVLSFCWVHVDIVDPWWDNDWLLWADQSFIDTIVICRILWQRTWTQRRNP